MNSKAAIFFFFFFLYFRTVLSSQNVVLPSGFLETKGDLKLATGYAVTLYREQYEGPSSEDILVSVAYSPIKYLGLKLDYACLVKDLYKYGNGYAFRYAMGGYLPLMEQHKQMHLFIDNYIGFQHSRYRHSTPITSTKYLYNTISNSTSVQLKLTPYPSSLNNVFYKISIGQEALFTSSKTLTDVGENQYVDLLYYVSGEIGLKGVSLFYLYGLDLSTDQLHRVGFSFWVR